MKRISRVIATLIISDLFLFFGLGLLSPIFGVYVPDHIDGSSLEVVGTATSVYWIARVLSVIPISRIFDKVKGERDEFYAVVFGTYALALLPLLYLFASQPLHIYLIEMGKGIANSLAIPAWRVLFTKFVDHKLIGLEWSLQDISVGLATASSAYIGAVIADTYGFKTVFALVGIIGFIGATILTFLYREKRIKDNHTGLMAWIIGKSMTKQAPLKVDTIK